MRIEQMKKKNLGGQPLLCWQSTSHMGIKDKVNHSAEVTRIYPSRNWFIRSRDLLKPQIGKSLKGISTLADELASLAH